MKRVLFGMLIIVLIVASITGCGGKDDGVDVDVNNDEATIKNDNSEVTYSTDLDHSIDIPDGYPHEVIPIYKDLMVTVAAKHDDGSYVVIGFSEDKLEEVVNFYEKYLADAEVMMKSNDSENYISIGNYKGAAYTVSAGPALDDELDFETMLNIVVTPTEFLIGDEENTEDSSSSSDTYDTGEFVIPEGMDIPKDYPSDSMPVMEEKEGKLAIVDENDGKTLVGYMTKSEFDDVIAYYDDIFKDVENLSVTVMGPTTVYMGIIDGKMYEVGITENSENTGEDLSYKTLIRIIYF